MKIADAEAVAKHKGIAVYKDFDPDRVVFKKGDHHYQWLTRDLAVAKEAEFLHTMDAIEQAFINQFFSEGGDEWAAADPDCLTLDPRLVQRARTMLEEGSDTRTSCDVEIITLQQMPIPLPSEDFQPRRVNWKGRNYIVVGVARNYHPGRDLEISPSYLSPSSYQESVGLELSLKGYVARKKALTPFSVGLTPFSVGLNPALMKVSNGRAEWLPTITLDSLLRGLRQRFRKGI